MSKIYNVILQLLTIRPPKRRTADELPGLSARDWADLPTYHPLTDEARTC